MVKMMGMKRMIKIIRMMMMMTLMLLTMMIDDDDSDDDEDVEHETHNPTIKKRQHWQRQWAGDTPEGTSAAGMRDAPNMHGAEERTHVGQPLNDGLRRARDRACIAGGVDNGTRRYCCGCCYFCCGCCYSG